MKKPLLPILLLITKFWTSLLFIRDRHCCSIILLLILTLLTSQCEKSVPPSILTPITNIGINNFSCEVDGDIFVAYDVYFIFSRRKIRIKYYPDHGILNISGNQIDSEGNTIQSLSFSVRNVFGEKTYPLYSARHFPTYSRLDTNKTNQLTILKFDLKSRIVSGLFEMSLIDSDSLTYDIRSGRFDVKF